jgi:ketosteroid isomerase-like protein
MDIPAAVVAYYTAWQRGDGDFAAVPLATDLDYTGPVASLTGADALRGMATQAAPAVTRFAVRRQFVDGDTTCSIIDWEMAGLSLTAAELLTVRDGQIVRGENIYDAEELRRVFAAMQGA